MPPENPEGRRQYRQKLQKVDAHATGECQKVQKVDAAAATQVQKVEAPVTPVSKMCIVRTDRHNSSPPSLIAARMKQFIPWVSISLECIYIFPSIYLESICNLFLAYALSEC